MSVIADETTLQERGVYAGSAFPLLSLVFSFDTRADFRLVANMLYGLGARCASFLNLISPSCADADLCSGQCWRSSRRMDSRHLGMVRLFIPSLPSHTRVIQLAYMVDLAGGGPSSSKHPSSLQAAPSCLPAWLILRPWTSSAKHTRCATFSRGWTFWAQCWLLDRRLSSSLGWISRRREGGHGLMDLSLG